MISLANSAGECKILVRAYADEVGELPPEQEAQLAVQFLGHLIETGWSPDQYRGDPGELVIPRGFSGSHSAAAARQRDNQAVQRTVAPVHRSWLQRMFGRGAGR